MKPAFLFPMTPVLGVLLVAGSATSAQVVLPPASATERIESFIVFTPIPPDVVVSPVSLSPRHGTMDPLPPDTDPRPDFARFVFDNVFDLRHPKELSFTGTMQFTPGTPIPPDGAVVGVTFDWFDPRPDPSGTGPVGWVNSDPFAVNLFGPDPITVTIPPGGEPYVIDFCPPQVSIEFFFLVDPPIGTHVSFSGDFTHTCVPEPAATAAAFGMALAGFALWRRQQAR